MLSEAVKFFKYFVNFKVSLSNENTKSKNGYTEITLPDDDRYYNKHDKNNNKAYCSNISLKGRKIKIPTSSINYTFNNFIE